MLNNNILRKIENPSYGIHKDLNLKNILRNVGNYLTYLYEIFTKWNTLNNNINRGRKTILKILFEVQMFQKNRGALVQNSRVILVKMSLKV